MRFFSWLVLTTYSTSSAEESGFKVGKIEFNRDVRPILTQHCTACHGGVKQAGRLSFVHADQAMSVIDPGDPECYMIERVLDPDEESRMPPPEHGPRLSDDDITTLETWIEQGAIWGNHWAYAKPIQPNRPQISNDDWPRQPIDWFVMRKLDQKKISVSPDEIPLR